MAEHGKNVNARDASGAADRASSASSFELGVQYLTSQGVSQAEAEQNLAQLVTLLPPDFHRLLEDERYSQALEMMSGQAVKEQTSPEGFTGDNQTAPSGFESAVIYLISQGLSRAEAEHNLALLLFYLPVHEPPRRAIGGPNGVF
jgi:hypothetical protein